jgi:hypothetical protein
MGLITFTDQFVNSFIQGCQCAVYFPVVSHLPRAAGFGDGNINGIFVDIHTDKYAIAFHDLPPWFGSVLGFATASSITQVCKDGRFFLSGSQNPGSHGN